MSATPEPTKNEGGGHQGPPPLVVRVLPDVPAIDRPFDYLVPATLADRIEPGTVVRVALHGRRVRGWVVAIGVEPVAGVGLRPVARITGRGPGPELIELAGWAAWRWAGRRVHFLRAATPRTAVVGLPARPHAPGGDPEVGWVRALAEEGLSHHHAVLRLPPAADALAVVQAAARQGSTLVVVASLAGAADLATRLRSAGEAVALLPGGWAQAAAGARVVVGARAAAWAPVVDLGAAVVLDEHDEAHQSEAAPTWHAREVVAERTRRAGARCLWVSPCPSLEALSAAPLVTASRAEERRGWPVVDVVDRRREEPMRAGLYAPHLVELLRRAAAAAQPGEGPQAVCVLNRKGRAALSVCGSCAEVAACERCQAAVIAGEGDDLVCRRCRSVRPSLCLACGSTRLKRLRPGVRRAREDLEHLTGVAVAEVSADVAADGGVPPAAIVVGTEAVLHRHLRPRLVAFLDLDAELLAPRYRAAEQAMALLARAARLLGGRTGGGRLVLQTRLPGHEVVLGALHADPGRVAAAERDRRSLLRLPPAGALAVVSGPPAPGYAEAVAGQPGVEVLGPDRDRWLVRAADHATLCDALAATPRPPGLLRVAVDPPRL
ncbi:MAG TPA: hypothetical protein VNT56_07790 [Acidimicrobiales bacterium]|nr:hypothetical protein [Acidimicrobiales bacterium]